jgi:hypothetical protein
VPGPNESQSDFVSRFVSNDAMEAEYPDHKQRVAVAHAQWRKSLKRAKLRRA